MKKIMLATSEAWLMSLCHSQRFILWIVVFLMFEAKKTHETYKECQTKGENYHKWSLITCFAVRLPLLVVWTIIDVTEQAPRKPPAGIAGGEATF